MAASTGSGGTPTKILTATAVLYLGAVGFYFRGSDGHTPLAFSTQGFQNVGATVGPLVAITTFIERAVEVVIATTRGPRKLALERALASADAAGKDAAQKAWDAHTLETQRIAFTVALGFSLFATLVGVRAVAPLLALAPPPPQARAFDAFDVILTSLLLAGGTDGVHQVVTTIISVLDASKSTGKQRTPPDPPG